jgi:RNA polymerase primary sigma factor
MSTATLDRPSAERTGRLAVADHDSIDQYLRAVGQHGLLTPQEETELGLKARAGDEAAIGELATRNLRFVVSIAKKYQHRGVTLGDLIGEGNVGLLTAARKFDPALGVRFISYAVWWIRQSIQTAIVRQSSIVRVPTGRAAELARLNRTADALRQELLREPTLREVADASGVEPRDASAAGRLHDVSLDAPLNADGEQSLLDRFTWDDDVDAETGVATAELGEQLRKALALLPARDARILRLHFGLEGGREHTLVEIGALLGVTRERVRQIRDRALRRLRTAQPA